MIIINKDYISLTKGTFNSHYIKTLYSSETIRTTSKDKKKLLKLELAALFLNILEGLGRDKLSADLIDNIIDLLDSRDMQKISKSYLDYRKYLFEQINIDGIYKLQETDIDEFIIFARKVMDDICTEGVSVLTREECERFIWVNKKFQDKEFLWLGVGIENAIYPLIPELMIWSDLKVQWNMFAKQSKEMSEWFINANDHNIFYKDKKTIEGYHQLGAYERQVAFLLITFVESFLYNVYNLLPIICCNSPKIRQLKNKNKFNVKNMTDFQIIEDVLYDIYPRLSQDISENYTLYKEIVNLRDRYVHISIKKDDYDKPSMRKLLSRNGLGIEFKIKKILEMVFIVNNFLSGDTLNTMFWFKDDISINYIEHELFPLVK